MDSRFQVTQISPENLFVDRLPAATRRAFLTLSSKGLPIFDEQEWYLAGGTALALQVGHRQSQDLDFFTVRPSFKEKALEAELIATKNWRTRSITSRTLYGFFQNCQASFIAYPFFTSSRKFVSSGKIKILMPHDIAVMKIIAISQRGRKRDFVDLFWYCQKREPLIDVLKRVSTHYPAQKHNFNHFLTSLSYFADAEEDPMPKIFFKASWKEIKKFFQKEVVKISKKYFGLEQR